MDESVQKHLAEQEVPPAEQWALWSAADGWCEHCLAARLRTRESVAKIHDPAIWAKRLNFIMQVP